MPWQMKWISFSGYEEGGSIWETEDKAVGFRGEGLGGERRKLLEV